MMSVIVDHEPLAAESLGFNTVGQVLSHVAGRRQRLVVNLLIDGRSPDLATLPALRAASLLGKTLFIETASPREIADDVLNNLSAVLTDADRAATDAVQLLRQNQLAAGMQKLSSCFATWQSGPESVRKVAQLLSLDLEAIQAGPTSLADVLAIFTDQLRQMKSAIELKDYVALCDVLAYELPETTARWRQAIAGMREPAPTRAAA